MNDKFQKVIETVVPFLLVGVGIALFIGLLYMFFFIAIWGLIIGGVLWLAALAKQYLFPSKPKTSEQGRVIEHDDKK